MIPSEELIHWLTLPKEAVFTTFEAMSGAVAWRGSRIGERLVYIPGTRKDRVVLVAHGDTVWDNQTPPKVWWKPVDETYIVRTPLSSSRGIGGDDRCGCAALWALRDLGHSLLLTDGEEPDRSGNSQKTAFCLSHHDDLAWLWRELQTHAFALEFDYQGANEYKMYDVGTREFGDYVEDMIGFVDAGSSSYTDICEVCYKMPGANLSIGFCNEHRVDEFVMPTVWQHNVSLFQHWLKQPRLPKFRRM